MKGADSLEPSHKETILRAHVCYKLVHIFTQRDGRVLLREGEEGILSDTRFGKYKTLSSLV